MWVWLNYIAWFLIVLVPYFRWKKRPWGLYVQHVEAFNQVFLRVRHPRPWPLPWRNAEYLYKAETEGQNAYWISSQTGETWADEGNCDNSDPAILLTGMLEFGRARALQAHMAAVHEIEIQARHEADKVAAEKELDAAFFDR